MAKFLVSYIGEKSPRGGYRDIDVVSFDGGQEWWSWAEDFEDVTCPDAEERGEVVVLQDGDVVFFESAYDDQVFMVTIDGDDDELIYNIQERIYPT